MRDPVNNHLFLGLKDIINEPRRCGARMAGRAASCGGNPPQGLSPVDERERRAELLDAFPGSFSEFYSNNTSRGSDSYDSRPSEYPPVPLGGSGPKNGPPLPSWSRS